MRLCVVFSVLLLANCLALDPWSGTPRPRWESNLQSQNPMPLTKTPDFVFPKDCFCVDPVYCHQSEFDSRNDQMCEEGKVCCFELIDEGNPYESENFINAEPLNINEKPTAKYTPQKDNGYSTNEENRIKEFFPTRETDIGFEVTTEETGSHLFPTTVYEEEATTRQENLGNNPKREIKPDLSSEGCVCPCQKQAVENKGKQPTSQEVSLVPVSKEEPSEDTIDFSEVEGSQEPTPSSNAMNCGVDKRHLLVEYKVGIKENSGNSAFAEFPWTLLVKLKPNGILCGATLIAPNFAVTAAHCVAGREAKSLTVRAGEWNTNNTYESYEHQDITVKKIFVHPNYTRDGLHNDIALLRLETAFIMEPHINVICLPSDGEKFSPQCTATGWGARKLGNNLVASGGSIMKKVQVKIERKKSCEEKLRETELGENFHLSASALCASSTQESIDTYLGDGGGPLFCPSLDKKRKHVSLIGIVSWGKPNYRGAPGVYTSVRLFREWLEDIMYYSSSD